MPTSDLYFSGPCMRADHERLERAFQDIAERTATGEWRELDVAWDDFAKGLELHMRFEEETFFPALASWPGAAMEIAALLEEHAEFRQRMGSLGVAIQIHEVRKDEIAELLSRLRAHAAREDRTLYRWAEEYRAQEARPGGRRIRGRSDRPREP